MTTASSLKIFPAKLKCVSKPHEIFDALRPMVYFVRERRLEVSLLLTVALKSLSSLSEGSIFSPFMNQEGFKW
jgi:hypothetical protein